MIDLFQFYNRMQKSNILLSFTGNISEDLLGSILSIIEEKLNKEDTSSLVKKRVYNILIECLQNLFHHSDQMGKQTNFDLLDETKNAIFTISKADHGYQIITGNFILSTDVDKLRTKIEHINSLNQNDLKTHYLNTLNNGLISQKGGGGLGLIDMARRSGNKLDYDFYSIDQLTSFFTLGINISLN